MHFCVVIVRQQDASLIAVFGGRKGDWESSVKFVEIFHDSFVKIYLVFLWPHNLSYTLIQNINCFILLERQ